MFSDSLVLLDPTSVYGASLLKNNGCPHLLQNVCQVDDIHALTSVGDHGSAAEILNPVRFF